MTVVARGVHIEETYIGTVPGLFYGGCHGDDEQAVFAELCEIAEENIAIYHERGIPLPPPTIDGRLADALLNGDDRIGAFNSDQRSDSPVGNEGSRRSEEIVRLQMAIEKGIASGISGLSIAKVLEQARARAR
ncbi:MAG: hypothetical protein WBJ75_06200 [Pseudohongiellaceae bacterium]